MTIERVGTADEREAWLEQRKQYLTASAVYGWRGKELALKKNAWYFSDNNREAICAEKFEGFEKEFPPAAVVAMAHGSFDEENILRKFEENLGYKCEADNSMFTNSRWPHIAATVDGYVHTDFDVHDVHDCGINFCQDTEAFPALRARVAGRGTGILEIKKSISVAWAKGEVPEYYIAQVQTQLHVTGLKWAIICAECVCPHPTEKWRKFWDLRPTLIKPDPAWAIALDQANEEFGQVKATA